MGSDIPLTLLSGVSGVEIVVGGSTTFELSGGGASGLLPAPSPPSGVSGVEVVVGSSTLEIGVGMTGMAGTGTGTNTETGTLATGSGDVFDGAAAGKARVIVVLGLLGGVVAVVVAEGW